MSTPAHSIPKPHSQPTLLLTRGDVARFLTLPQCIAAVERAFRMHGEGALAAPGVLGMHAHDGGFHIKAAFMAHSGHEYFVAKTNANFMHNRERYGMPSIQGVVLLSDASNGSPLALMDSVEITTLRTGAATAVAAKYLARQDAATVAICGCGNQGRSQLRSVAQVRQLQRGWAHDADAETCRHFATEMSRELGIEIRAVDSAAAAAREADIVVTCTPSKQPLLHENDVRPGTFIAAVGADNPEKQEIAPALMAASRVVTDVTDQCVAIGDLHHAMAAGTMRREQVHGELGEVVSGKKPGRTAADQIIVFDSTGVAFQDAAAAIAVYNAALDTGSGSKLDLLR